MIFLPTEQDVLAVLDAATSIANEETVSITATAEGIETGRNRNWKELKLAVK